MLRPSATVPADKISSQWSSYLLQSLFALCVSPFCVSCQQLAGGEMKVAHVDGLRPLTELEGQDRLSAVRDT